MDMNTKQNLVFALDIGTRSVVGVVGQMVGDTFEIVDYEQRFHAKRAMRDGQIEDITLVARVVKDVRETLENRLGVQFNKVSIAAAGRSLKTVRVEYNQEVDPADEITEKLIEGAEYSALGKAMDEFSQSDENNKKFHCVGYSVVRNALDDYEMSNLVGHKGSKVTMDLIVAFLPHNVVEGLYATMMINGLEVENLTLEPMAAIHVIVPKDIRLLNIALVDIGAGTSDIAICRNGGISAYDMVTVAGDELTEKLMHTYLVDFDEAEKIKLSLSDDKENIVFKDVLGFETVASKATLMEIMQPAISDLGAIISQRILDVNTTSPVAVFVVGGGSQVAGLCEEIAKNLGLPQNRVTVGGRQGFKYVKLCSEKLQSPEFVTPVGIGAVLSERAGTDFFAITVNGNKIMLLRQGEIKVMEAILLAGIKPTALIGVPQRPVNYTVNGEKRTFRLEYTTGEIRINGELASIDSTLTRGDALVVIPAKITEKEFVTSGDIKQEVVSTRVGLHGEWKTLEIAVEVNGKEVTDEYVIVNGDEITTHTKNSVKDFCNFLGIDWEGKTFEIDGVKVDADYALQSNDMLKYDEIPDFIKNQSQGDGGNRSKGLKTVARGDGGEVFNSTAQSVRVETEKSVNQEAKFNSKRADFLQGKRKISVSIKATSPQKEGIALPEEQIKNKEVADGQNPLTGAAVETKWEVITNQEKSLEKSEIIGKETEQAIAKNTTDTEDFALCENQAKDINSNELVATIQKQDEPKEKYIPYESRNENGYITVTINGAPIKVKKEDGEKLLFVNMLNYVNIQREAPGENLVLSINSNPAAYTDEVKENDSIIIRWE